MSFEQKYLKYKSKYLALKIQVKNTKQLGGLTGGSMSGLTGGSMGGLTSGSIYGKKFDDLEYLSQTPLMTEKLAFKLKGGDYSSNADYKKLASLLNNNDNIYTTEVSEFSQSAGFGSESESESKSPSEQTESGSESQSQSEQTESESESKSQSGSESEQNQTELTDTPKLDESEQVGGKKAKSHKKYFFGDSDVVFNSTTTDSDLSSLDTDTTDDSDSDLNL